MSGAENHGPGTPSHKTSGAPEDIPGVNTEWDLSGDAFKDLGPYQVEEAFDPESWDLAIDDLCEGGMPKSVPPSENCEVFTETCSSSLLHLDQYESLKKIPSRKKKRVRGPKNWEFLIRLLANPRSNPSLIRWEDEDTATFRLVQPYAIVKLWASRTKAALPMSYNNFARGLRYHYKTGALESVSEKQLVYRCGPLALRFLRDLKLRSS
ncbi:ETS-related transcription factor Elf-5 isoform X2 [Penaeus vannamei]|uniref:ETS-related transcription factor Elf-3 n=2 Tax=Penaeus vannamei TaxID=6689 RepID=A0A423SNB9_PENVA|nr:ETS-related transcription factor Elf-3 [Penaeus vannamei]